METQHERSIEHTGFREEHESMKAGMVGLAFVSLLTGGVMAFFYRENAKEHAKMKAQIANLFGVVEDHEAELMTMDPAVAKKVFDTFREIDPEHVRALLLAVPVGSWQMVYGVRVDRHGPKLWRVHGHGGDLSEQQAVAAVQQGEPAARGV